MNNEKHERHIGCNHGEAEYRKRVYEYSISKQYDSKITKLYENSQIKIKDSLFPIDKFFITYNLESLDFHLMNVESEYSDILLESMEKYNYDSVVRFRDTTAFIELINSDIVTISDNVITIIDNAKAIEIIKKWDGYIHDKVAKTDAVKNKNILKNKKA